MSVLLTAVDLSAGNEAIAIVVGRQTTEIAI